MIKNAQGQKYNNLRHGPSCYSCFAHAVNLAVGAFINGLSPKWGSKSGTDKDKPLIPGPILSQRYDELDIAVVEDDEEELETLCHELDEIEKSSVEMSSINASALLLQIWSFVAKVRSISYNVYPPWYQISPHIGSPVWTSKEISEEMLQIRRL